MGQRFVALGLGLLSPLLWGGGASALAASAAAGPSAPPSGATVLAIGQDATTTPTLGPAMQPSTAEQVALVEHLRRQGVLFYGAWWCPACFKQKNLFGQQAGNQLPYVECEKTEEQRERCERANIQAYPTWVMGTQRLEGIQTLQRLGEWSGFQK